MGFVFGALQARCSFSIPRNKVGRGGMRFLIESRDQPLHVNLDIFSWTRIGRTEKKCEAIVPVARRESR